MVLQVIVGMLVGAAAAALHLKLALWAAERTARSGRSGLTLATMPIRVAVPAAAVGALALWGQAALIAGVVAFAVVHRLGAGRLARQGDS